MNNVKRILSPSNGMLAVEDTRIYYELAGDGPGLVLLHAGIADSRMWDQQVQAFAESHTVLRYDLAGFGRSPHPAGRYAHYLHLAGLLEHFGLAPVSLVAVSMGGALALEFAVAYPTAVNRIVLSGTGVGLTAISDERSARALQINEAFERGDISLANELEVRMWVDGPQRSPEDVDAGVRSQVSAMNLALLQSMPEDDHEFDLEPTVADRLSEVTHPVLLITGELDMPDVHDAARLLETTLPDSSSVAVPGAAHMVNMEQPELFNRLVLEFLQG